MIVVIETFKEYFHHFNLIIVTVEFSHTTFSLRFTDLKQLKWD